MVERIQRTRPDIEITWIIGKVEHMLVGDIPGIHFIIFDKSLGRFAYKDLKNKLNNKAFDLLFLMQVAFRANIASLVINAKSKVGFDSGRSKELHGLFVDKRIGKQEHPHVLDGFMAFADCVGIPDVGALRWHIPLPEQHITFAEAHRQKVGEYVVICPSASKAERNWSIEGYQKAAAFAREKGFAVVLCGGPAAHEIQLAEAIAKSGMVSLNLVGQTNLKQLLAVLKLAKLVIAPDTGPAHMATTVGTDVIGLYAHSNPKRTGPYKNVEHVVSVYEAVIEEQKGKPWQQLDWGVRAKGENLMSRISLDAVKEQMEKLLD